MVFPEGTASRTPNVSIINIRVVKAPALPAVAPELAIDSKSINRAVANLIIGKLWAATYF